MAYRAAVVGASGYTGVEALRLLAGHPEIEVVHVTAASNAGTKLADLYPSLTPAYGDTVLAPLDVADLRGLDLVFCMLPHGASQDFVPAVLDDVAHVIDLGADFRLPPDVYTRWYREPHRAPEIVGRFAYGMVELYRDDLANHAHVAAPGCYPTAVCLALAPLVRAGVLDPAHVIVDAASGVSGAGKAAKPSTTFNQVDGNFTAYGLLDHRHTPEMEAHSGATVLFTPHLAPMSRGILATCYGRATGGHTTADALEVLSDAYADEPFVVVSERIPQTKSCQGSNTAHLTVRVDDRTGTVIALSAIDNLVKGTAGQAIQCLNLMAGLGEITGLPRAGVAP